MSLLREEDLTLTGNLRVEAKLMNDERTFLNLEDGLWILFRVLAEEMELPEEVNDRMHRQILKDCAKITHKEIDRNI